MKFVHTSMKPTLSVVERSVTHVKVQVHWNDVGIAIFPCSLNSSLFLSDTLTSWCLYQTNLFFLLVHMFCHCFSFYFLTSLRDRWLLCLWGETEYLYLGANAISFRDNFSDFFYFRSRFLNLPFLFLLVRFATLVRSFALLTFGLLLFFSEKTCLAESWHQQHLMIRLTPRVITFWLIIHWTWLTSTLKALRKLMIHRMRFRWICCPLVIEKLSFDSLEKFFARMQTAVTLSILFVNVVWRSREAFPLALSTDGNRIWSEGRYRPWQSSRMRIWRKCCRSSRMLHG